MIALRNILVASDLSITTEAALVCGRALAHACGATLHVLHVVDHVFVGPFVADPQRVTETARTYLDMRLTEDDRNTLHARVVVDVSHDPAKAIVSYARTSGIDLVVTGTRGRHGAARVVLGSVAEQVVRTAPCPVLTVRRSERLTPQMEVAMITLKNILVATDFGEAADVALTYGRELAGRFGATLHVLHVADNIYINAFGAETYAAMAPDLQTELEASAPKKLDELLIDSDRSGPPTKRALLTSSSPAFAIVDFAKDNNIDLIVMGTHGRGALAHLVMGSVAERVVRLAACPVLTVRHPEHEFVLPDSPVKVTHA